MPDDLERRLPGLGRTGIGDLRRVEAGAEQELRLVGNERTDRTELSPEAEPVAQDARQAEAPAVAETGKQNRNRAGIAAHGRNQRIVIRGRLQNGCRRVRFGDDTASCQINENHKEPP